MTVYKRTDEWGDQWRYRKRVTLPDGRSIRIAGTPEINTKRAAEEAERAHVERVLNPPKPVVERRRMSDVFDRFLSDYVTTANNKPSEVAQKRSTIELHLRPAIGPLFADEISHERIVELSAKLHRTPKARRGKGNLSAKAVKNILQTLRKCLRWARDMGWIGDVPKVQMPKVDEAPIRFLEDSELDALLTAAASEPLWYAAVVLAADAGLRQGELRALRWTDWNQVTNKLVIQRSRWRNQESTPKSRKPRSIPLTVRLKAALDAIKETRLRGQYVLSRRDGGAFGAEYMQESIERLTRRAKIADCGWHSLRHTFCTRLAMRGALVRTIQELAGHADIATTMRYMHVAQGAADDAIALLDGDRARSGHGPDRDADIDAEGGEVVQLVVVTPKGLEPLFSA